MFIFFVHKKDNKVPPSPGTSEGCINIFAWAMAFFNRAKFRTFLKNLNYFRLLDTMF